MALARKCDICGVLYESYETSIEGIGECNGIAFIHFGLYEFDKYVQKSMDCCPKCFRSIQEHIKKLKENNNA